MADDEQLSTGEVAKALGKTEQTIRNWIDQGRIRAERSGRAYLIPRSELERIAAFEVVRAGLQPPDGERENPSAERHIWRRRRELAASVNSAEDVEDHFYAARDHWHTALTAHAMAPPDAGFAGRLHDFAAAAREYSQACLKAHKSGYEWPSHQPAAGPPYELRPGTGRRGPAALWAKFDEATGELDRMVSSRSMQAVGRTYSDLADAAAALAVAVENEDRDSGLLGRSADPSPSGHLRRVGDGNH